MCNTNKNRIIEKNNKIIEENKNNFIKIGIINNINYSNYLINENGDITNIKGKLRKTAINDGYSCIALIGINNDYIKEYHVLKIHRLVAYIYI
uniref:Uncharacterized protein n=1 Tax=viral metagenome TaxID=1070528 RepID=A0A6C0ECS9_9ZZZZ